MDESSTRGPEYAARLEATTASRQGWRRWLDPQRPYRWNIRRLHLGRVLDVGCGTGRNLAHLDGNGVGVDHNETAVAIARSRGLRAWITAEFASSADAVPRSFDTVLFAHVLEHMTPLEASALVHEHLRYVRPGGRVVVICPQQRGQRSDPTHVTYMPPEVIAALLAEAGVSVERTTSFPLPSFAGRWFTHNETIVVGRTAEG
ncbi:MAG: class I SAM-dependent methyltransferase [Actinobacteria bacterium]|nr:class I SAM-dependent methyltransferase [Actinomycetota bacterium]